MSSRWRGGVPFVTAVVGCLASAPRAAGAWGTAEHQQIGQTSYAEACARLAPAAALRGATDKAVTLRFEHVCGRNAPVLARLYGDATAIAGDFLGHPSEFLSHVGAWRFSSKKHYLLLALENSQHFNPMATQSWRSYHQRAIGHALEAAAAPGLASIEEFELAVHESAFADHFLQDSFAAGHMGFNRSASSAAAAKGFHDYWNVRGRVVTDRAGGRWATYGDGRLNSEPNADSRRHVMNAATLSVHHLLLAFVLGERSTEEELAVWQSLPFTIEAPELLVDAVEVFTREDAAADRQLVPLLATVRPARKDTVFNATVWSAAPFEHAGDAIATAMAGVDLAVPNLPAQAYLGVGGSFYAPGGRQSVVLDTGMLVPLLLSVEGLISHEVGATASWLFQGSPSTILHLEYQMNVELGDVLLSLQAGVAEFLPQAQTGWYGALGLGYTFSVAGGGAF